MDKKIGTEKCIDGMRLVEHVIVNVSIIVGSGYNAHLIMPLIALCQTN